MTQTPEQSQPKQSKKKRSKLKWFVWLSVILSMIITPLIALTIYVVTIYPTLPDAASLKDVTYQVPLRIVTEEFVFQFQFH